MSFDWDKGWKDPPPGIFSTKTHAQKLAKGLRRRTGVPWRVTLVEHGECVGGMYIAPAREDGMCEEDWEMLRSVFPEVCFPAFSASRWFIFADEIQGCLRQACSRRPLFSLGGVDSEDVSEPHDSPSQDAPEHPVHECGTPADHQQQSEDPESQ